MLSKINGIVQELIGIKEMEIVSPWVYVPCGIAVFYALIYFVATN